MSRSAKSDRFLATLLDELGISESEMERRRLTIQPQASDLVEVCEGERRHKLTPGASRAWIEIREEADASGYSIRLVSAFRSVEYQAEIIRRKLNKGEDIRSILRVNAAPGYSEHHTGNAIDVTTDECEPLSDEFEKTEAFKWLACNAHLYDFSLSYPRGNPYGYAYEPWHWCFQHGQRPR